MSQTKSLQYAYPTSWFAHKNGFGATGCWYVAIYNKPNDKKPIEYLAISDNKASVQRIFNEIPLPINTFHSQRISTILIK